MSSPLGVTSNASASTSSDVHGFNIQRGKHNAATTAESLEGVQGNINMLQIQAALPRDDERCVLASSAGSADRQTPN